MKILVVVDMQNDFIDGALGTPEAQAIVPNVIKKVEQYSNSDSLIFYTKDTHNENYLNTQEGKNLPIPHCIMGTDGWEIKEGIYRAGSLVVNKNTFGSRHLPFAIQSNAYEVESIEVVGLCTDICVISNVMLLKAYYPEVPITVISSCCAGVTPESHTNALRAMEMCQINMVEEVF